MRTKKTTKSKSNTQNALLQMEVTENKIYRAVKRVMDEADPESLLKLGCPEDEYDPVSKRVAERVAAEGGNKLSVTELANILAFALHLSFGTWSRPVTLHVSHFDLARRLKPEIAKEL